MNDEDQTTNPQSEDSQNKKEITPEKDEIDFESLYLRAKADLENYRRQVERDQQNFAKFAGENTLIALLPILDNFKRAATHLPEDLEKNEWVKGITGIEKQFEQTLENLGLQKIKAQIGKICDAHLHEAIAIGDGESGKILEILEEGYELNGKVLRASKVKVGK